MSETEPDSRPRAAAALGVAAALALAVLAAPGAAAQPRAEVDAATTGAFSELRKTVPITRRPAAEPRVVLSLGPGKLSALRDGDRLELLSETQVTVDCDRPSARCAGRPYAYDPHVRVSLVIARGRSPQARARTVARRDLTCRQRLPNRQHHCPVAFDRTVQVSDGLPCQPDRCFANVIVSADDPAAGSHDRMIIGANKPSGRIVQNKSRLSAILIGRGVGARRLATHQLRRRSLRLRPQRKVILSRRVDDLERGDVLAASASLRSDVRHLGYNALVGAELIVARGPQATAPSRVVRRSVWQQGLISPTNGTNCTPAQSPCLTRKVGAIKVRRDVVGGSGTAAPLFVNLVLRTKQKRVGREHGARLRLLRRAVLSVRRYPR